LQEANAMAVDPEELLPRKKPAAISLGEDLSTMSEQELVARIAELEAEIARSRDAIKSRQATKAAADIFFRK
jgi:uncharacterized small protein (DUF1192 family)